MSDSKVIWESDSVRLVVGHGGISKPVTVEVSDHRDAMDRPSWRAAKANAKDLERVVQGFAEKVLNETPGFIGDNAKLQLGRPVIVTITYERDRDRDEVLAETEARMRRAEETRDEWCRQNGEGCLGCEACA